MSGFAALNGEPDGPPLLPPLALADGVAAPRDRLRDHGRAARAGDDRPRPGRRHVARRAADDAARPAADARTTCSASCSRGPATARATTRRATSTARPTAAGSRSRRARHRSPSACCASSGAPTSSSEPWFATGSGRVEHVDEIDAAVAAWIARARPRRGAGGVRGGRGGAIAPIYDASDMLADPQLAALGAIASVDDAELGPLRMPNVISRLSETPGEIRHVRRPRTAPTRPRSSASSASTRTSSRGSEPTGSCDGRSPADVALRPGRPARPSREGDRLPRARRHRRPRGRRRAGAAKDEARAGLAGLLLERPPRSSSTSASTASRRLAGRPRGGRRGLQASSASICPRSRRRRPERRARAPRRRASGPLLIESAAGVEDAYRDRVGAGRRRASRSARPISAPRPERSRPGSTGRAGGSSTPPSPPACRDRRSRSTRTCATLDGLAASCARGRELGHLGRAAIHPDQLPVIEQAYLPTEDEVARAREDVERSRRRRRRSARRRRIRRRGRHPLRAGRPRARRAVRLALRRAEPGTVIRPRAGLPP